MNKPRRISFGVKPKPPRVGRHPKMATPEFINQLCDEYERLPRSKNGTNVKWGSFKKLLLRLGVPYSGGTGAGSYMRKLIRNRNAALAAMPFDEALARLARVPRESK